MTAIHRVASAPTRARNIALVLLIACFIAMAFIGFWPTPVDRDAAGTIRQVVAWAHTHGMPAVDYASIEQSANVLFFVPLGALLTVVLRRRWMLAPLIVLLATSSIELGQLFLLPHRVASLTDVVMNTSGGLAGIVLVLVPRWPRSAKRVLKPAPHPRPHLGGRVAAKPHWWLSLSKPSSRT